MRMIWVVWLAGLVLAAACESDDIETFPATDGPSATVETPPIAATPCSPAGGCVTAEVEGNLTDEQVAFAIDAAESDVTLASLLSDAQYEVGVGSQPWEFSDGVTFVTVNFSLSDPLPIDATLPRLDTGSRGGESNPTTIELPSPGYLVEDEHYEMDAYEISALVYLETGEVMQIFPVPFALSGPDTVAP